MTLESLTLKRPSESRVIMTQLVLPHHTNQLGSIFGGTVMSWMDICGAVSAYRHVGGEVVTASVDDLHFLAPIYSGWVVEIKGQVFFAGKTSVDVFVKVVAENPQTQVKSVTSTCFLTFVARDKEGRPKPVPGLKLETEQDQKNFEIAKKRRELRRDRQSVSEKIDLFSSFS
jgi:acyl-CoA hydrolase